MWLFLALSLKRLNHPFFFLSHSGGGPLTVLTMSHFHFLWSREEN